MKLRTKLRPLVHKTSRQSILSIGILTFLSGSLVHAQDDNGEVFELSPFVVDASNDTGYRATSTLTGSRLNTSLKDSAASVAVFTEEFLDDTGFNSIEEIAQYSVSMRNDTQATSFGTDANNYLSGANVIRRLNIRGVRASQGLNYFESIIPDDSYRSQRYDESRGPNGILFGISNAGGIVNTSTVQASAQRDSGRVRYSFGSSDRSRLEARYNKVLIDDVLGVTVAGLTQRSEGFRDYSKDDRDRIYGAITYKLNKKITINAMGETGTLFQNRVIPFNATDSFSSWYANRELLGVAAVTTTNNGTNPSSALQAYGIVDDIVAWGSTANNNERYVYTANDGSFKNGAGLFFTESTYDRDVALEPGSTVGRGGDNYPNRTKVIDTEAFPYPSTLNEGGPDMYRETDFNYYSGSLDWSITENLFLNVGYGYQEVDIVNQFVSSPEPRLQGDPNANTRHLRLDAPAPGELNPYAGQLYFDAHWRKGEHAVSTKELRAALSYDLDFGDFENGWISKLGKHRMAVAMGNRETTDTFVDHRWGFLGNPFGGGNFEGAGNRIAIRNYIVEGDFSTYHVAGPNSDQTTIIDDKGVEQPIGWIRRNAGTNNASSDVDVKSKISVIQSAFWNQRLITTFGIREDDAGNLAYGHIVDPMYGDTLSSDPDLTRESPRFKATSETFGVVFNINDHLALLYNEATSIGLPEFRERVFPNANVADPVRGDGMDVGIAFDLFENKVSGRLVYYETSEFNRTSNGAGTRVLRDPSIFSMDALSEIRTADPTAIVMPNGIPYTDAEWTAEYDSLTPDVNSFLQDNVSSGIELTTTANITENWRLTLSASKTNRIESGYGRGAIDYFGLKTTDDGYLRQGIEEIGNVYTVTDRDAYVTGGSYDRILEIAANAIGNDASTIISSEDNESIAEMLWVSTDDLNSRKQEREARWGLQPYRFNLFSSYDLAEGRLKGVRIGGGYRWRSGTINGTDSSGIEIDAPSEGYFEFMLRYTQRLENKRSIDYQLNVYNLFDRADMLPVRYAIPTDPTSPLARNSFPEPRSVRATVTYSF